MTTVLVTRPAEVADSLGAELESRGYRVIAVPSVATRSLPVEWPDLERFDWIVVTSAAGVAVLPEVPPGPHCAAVGEATARALIGKGVSAEFVPREANGAALANTFPDPSGARILLVRGTQADPDLPAGLRERGALVEEVTAYETIEGPAESLILLRQAMVQGRIAAVLFASGSAVRGFVRLGGSTDVPAITIGPRTTAVARGIGFTVVAEASEPGATQLADAVESVIPVEVK